VSSPCCTTSSGRQHPSALGAGSAQDPKGKAACELMASLLDQGTMTRTAQEIADQIDFIGGDLGTAPNRPVIRERDRDEGFVPDGDGPHRRHHAQSGVRGRGNRSRKIRFCRRSA